MSLPPGFLEELRTRTTLSRVVGRKVTWDNRKSNLAKGDFWAPCPFHQEKTASFHVDDRKGFYYCFGCHAKGDALSFLREIENMGFMEAVETLAREAGMTMPDRDPAEMQRADRRAQLAEVMEAAVRHYRLQLKTGAAAEARAYLDRRQLTAATQDRFEIGFAPDQRQGVFSALTGKGVGADLLVEAGLCARPDDGGVPFDRFRGRIIFPIRDARGRCIGLGGRAMEANARAKYLNSPETPLFDKGRSLYNHAPAREAVARGQPLVVAEGYMDVIALTDGGFGGAVAPLGTAITEEQLRMLWRIHPEPIIALDGDTAGIRAAMRLVDLALPLLEAGQSLRFVLLPDGQDPDELIRGPGGSAAMQALLDQAQPMVRLLWQRETEGRVLDSPERKAAFDKSLREVIGRIRDSSIRAHYTEDIRQMRRALFAPAPQVPRRGGGPVMAAGQGRGSQGAGFRGYGRGAGPAPVAEPPLSETKNTLLASATGPDVDDFLREAMILAICFVHPRLIAAFEGQIERLALHGAQHEALRAALLRCHVAQHADFAAQVRSDAPEALEKVMSLAHVQTAPPVRNAADDDLARACLSEELEKLAARRGAAAEVADAIADLQGLPDEGLTWRLGQAARARHMAERSRLDDTTDMGEDRAALSEHLQRLILDEVWKKKKS